MAPLLVIQKDGKSAIVWGYVLKTTTTTKNTDPLQAAVGARVVALALEDLRMPATCHALGRLDPEMIMGWLPERRVWAVHSQPALDRWHKYEHLCGDRGALAVAQSLPVVVRALIVPYFFPLNVHVMIPEYSRNVP